MLCKTLILSLSVAVLIGCSDGGSSNSDESSNENTEGRTAFNPNDFVLTQSTDLTPYGSTQVAIELNNLVTDDPVYISVGSAAQENGQLTIKPHKTVLNPTDGAAAFAVNVGDTGVTAEPNLTVVVTTSGNTQMEQTFTVQLAK